MPRRLHVDHISVGQVELSQREAHHARDVLRLGEGAAVELFDSAGNVATGRIERVTPAGVSVAVDEIHERRDRSTLTIASAIPKGERADWMIEKLSELGVARFIPLAAERSVVVPGGKNKLDRWKRIAVEAAKQSRRPGVMQIDDLTKPADVTARPAFVLSTEDGATPIHSTIRDPQSAITLLIGPEGGWTDCELNHFRSSGVQRLKLTDTVLRIETAAIAAAAVVMTIMTHNARG